MSRRFLIACFVGIAPLIASVTVSSGQSASLTFVRDAQSQQIAPDPYTPAQIATAYDLTPLTDQSIDGSGQTIALIEFDSFSTADVHHFDAANQLPDPTIGETYVGGNTFRLTRSPETTLDLEWAHAMAPGAAIQLYYISSNLSQRAGWKAIGQAVTTAADNGASTISLSFGACKATAGYKATQQALAAAEKRAISVFVSSGDNGAFPGPRRDCGATIGVPYPASDPSVVAVGGTSLQLAGDNSIASEIAWQLSGGGKGLPLLRPTWEVAPQLHPGKYRWTPDVAFLADQNTGVEVYYNGRWIVVGGTSLGAPAWAGIWALVRQDAQQAGKSVGAAAPLIYRIANSTAYSSSFHDVIQGSNGHYHAGVGWDAVTGWGTPDVNGLATAVLATG